MIKSDVLMVLLDLVSVERPVCLLLIIPHLQRMLYTPGVSKLRSSLMWQRYRGLS